MPPEIKPDDDRSPAKIAGEILGCNMIDIHRVGTEYSFEQYLDSFLKTAKVHTQISAAAHNDDTGLSPMQIVGINENYCRQWLSSLQNVVKENNATKMDKRRLGQSLELLAKLADAHASLIEHFGKALATPGLIQALHKMLGKSPELADQEVQSMKAEIPMYQENARRLREKVMPLFQELATSLGITLDEPYAGRQ